MKILCVSTLFFILLAWSPGPDSTVFAQQDGSDTQGLANEIEALLTIQTKAWNQGDLEAFMGTYWKSDKLSFSGGGKTTFGWQATLDRYREGYAPPKEMGQLHFDHLDISAIEANSALTLGHWHLKMPDGTRRDGNFTLVLKLMDGKWKIIHDHSSTLKPEPEPAQQD